MKKSKLMASVLCTSLVLGITSGIYANEVSTYATEDKLSGNDRYETAVKVSQKGWSSSNNAIVVNSGSIVDALSVTPLAKLKDAPILLTTKDALNGATKNQLVNLGVKNVQIIGGENAISEKVRQELESMGISVQRIGGTDRHDTALKIANEISTIKPVSKIAVVNGYKGLADAVSIAAVAASEGMAILPADPNAGVNAFNGFIQNSDIQKSYIIGSTTAVSQDIEKTLPNPERLGGIDRNETNAKVINKFYTSSTLNNAYVAKDGMKNQDQLIDALAVGVLASKQNSPVVIVGNNLSATQKEIFSTKRVNTLTQVGSGGNENAFGEIKNLQETSEAISKVMYVTNTPSVNVRSTPSITGAKVGSLNEGDEVKVVSVDSAGWVKIEFGNGVGYISGSYLTKKHPSDTNETIKIKYVKENTLNIRKGPSTGDNVIGTLTKGQKVEQVEMYATGWVKIKFEGGYGFVSNTYLSQTPVAQ